MEEWRAGGWGEGGVDRGHELMWLVNDGAIAESYDFTKEAETNDPTLSCLNSCLSCGECGGNEC